MVCALCRTYDAHITTDCLLIVFLPETQPRGLFVLDGESNEPRIDFPQPIAPKMYLARFRNEVFFNGDKNNSFLLCSVIIG